MGNTRNFAEVIRRKLSSNPDLAEAVERESFQSDIAAKIYNARKAAKLTQQQLADRVQTKQSAVARWENAEYDSHSLSLLRRVAKALGCSIRVEFVPLQASPPPASSEIRVESRAERKTGKRFAGATARKNRP